MFLVVALVGTACLAMGDDQPILLPPPTSGILPVGGPPVIPDSAPVESASSIRRLHLVTARHNIEGARKEGKVVWYTPLIVNQAVRPLKEVFEKRYPYIKVDFHRANSRGLVQKWFTETQAKRHEADVVGGSEVTMLGKKAGLKQLRLVTDTATVPTRPELLQGAENALRSLLGLSR